MKMTLNDTTRRRVLHARPSDYHWHKSDNLPRLSLLYCTNDNALDELRPYLRHPTHRSCYIPKIFLPRAGVTYQVCIGIFYPNSIELAYIVLVCNGKHHRANVCAQMKMGQKNGFMRWEMGGSCVMRCVGKGVGMSRWVRMVRCVRIHKKATVRGSNAVFEWRTAVLILLLLDLHGKSDPARD
jgi:hypothetical protein